MSLEADKEGIDCQYCSAPDKMRIFISIMYISSPNPMFDHLLKYSNRDETNNRSTVRFGEEILQEESVDIYFYAPYLVPAIKFV